MSSRTPLTWVEVAIGQTPGERQTILQLLSELGNEFRFESCERLDTSFRKAICTTLAQRIGLRLGVYNTAG